MSKNGTSLSEFFAQYGYTVSRNPNNSRHYFINNRTRALEFKSPLKSDELIASIKKQGFDNFVASLSAATTAFVKVDGSGKKSQRAKKSKSTFNVTSVPASLRSRMLREEEKNREKAEAFEHSEPVVEESHIDATVQVNSMVVALPQQNVEKRTKVVDDLDSHLVKKYLSKEINYDVKIPREYEGYWFPSFMPAFLRRVSIGRNCFIAGPTGTGKTELLIKLSRVLDQKMVRVNFSVGTTEQHLIGRWTVRNGETVFQHGIIPLAMKYGWWIDFDEIDFAMPEHMAIMQPVLEGEPLFIAQTNEEIIPHKNFRIFATANTKGRGDETQGYVGTGNLNLAFLDRWAIFELDYTNKELQICKSIIETDDTLAEQIIQYFSVLRKAASEGQVINSVFSTRRLVQISESIRYGETLQEALAYEIFSRYDKHEVDMLKEIAYDVWDKDHYMKGWKLGDAHYTPPAGQQIQP